MAHSLLSSLDSKSTPNIDNFIMDNIIPEKFKTHPVVFQAYRSVVLDNIHKSLERVGGTQNFVQIDEQGGDSLNSCVYSIVEEIFPQFLDSGNSGVWNHIDECIDRSFVSEFTQAITIDLN